jgi:hypothetical protein
VINGLMADADGYPETATNAGAAAGEGAGRPPAGTPGISGVAG